MKIMYRGLLLLAMTILLQRRQNVVNTIIYEPLHLVW